MLLYVLRFLCREDGGWIDGQVVSIGGWRWDVSEVLSERIEV